MVTLSSNPWFAQENPWMELILLFASGGIQVSALCVTRGTFFCVLRLRKRKTDDSSNTVFVKHLMILIIIDK